MVEENFGATLKHLSWRRMRPPHDNGRRRLREGVRAAIGAQFRTTLEPIWWLDMSGQVYSQWNGYDEYGDKCRIDFHGYCPHAKDQWARRHLPWTISVWLVELCCTCSCWEWLIRTKHGWYARRGMLCWRCSQNGSLEKMQNASLCWRSKRTIAHINGKGGDC